MSAQYIEGVNGNWINAAHITMLRIELRQRKEVVAVLSDGYQAVVAVPESPTTGTEFEAADYLRLAARVIVRMLSAGRRLITGHALRRATWMAMTGEDIGEERQLRPDDLDGNAASTFIQLAR